jgi:hypothetical protein
MNLPLLGVRLDNTFAMPSIRHHQSEDQSADPTVHRLSSAHTYRLLIFKDRFAEFAKLHRVFCAAAFAAEKRDYVHRASFRQQVFSLSLHFVDCVVGLKPLPHNASSFVASLRFLLCEAPAVQRGGEYYSLPPRMTST